MNLETLIEFIKITIISCEQDLESISDEIKSLDLSWQDAKDLEIEHNYISGQITGMKYILRHAKGEA